MLVKICGITTIDDARYALDAGADWIGLNLVAGPRRIDLATAERILEQLDDPSCVVLLVRADRGRVSDSLLATLRTHGVSRIQLYGDQAPVAVRHLANAGFESIVVQSVADKASLARFDALLAFCGNDRPGYVLFDAGTPSRLGGSGRRADWETIARARRLGRYGDWPPVLLAGGLTPGNVAEAIEKVAPAGVDVSSGVELAPGRKDPAKVRAFVAAVRASRTNRP